MVGRRRIPLKPGRTRNATIRRRHLRRAARRRFRRERAFYYKQNVDGGVISGIAARYISQTAAPQNFAMEFRAADVANWTNFSGIYDQYAITKVVVKLIPMLNVNGVQPIAGQSLINPGVTGTVIDIDDATPLANLSAYEQYESFRQQNAMSGRPIIRSITPHSRTYMVQSGGASVPAGVVAKKWYDCAYGNISHCGLKWYLDQYYNINAAQTYQVFATYYMKFRNVR